MTQLYAIRFCAQASMKHDISQFHLNKTLIQCHIFKLHVIANVTLSLIYTTLLLNLWEMYYFLLHFSLLLNIDSCMSLIKKDWNKTLKQIEIKNCIAWGNVNEGAELVRVCNATTMIDVVRLVSVPEFPINLQSLGSLYSRFICGAVMQIYNFFIVYHFLLKRYCLYIHYSGESVLFIEFKNTFM